MKNLYLFVYFIMQKPKHFQNHPRISNHSKSASSYRSGLKKKPDNSQQQLNYRPKSMFFYSVQNQQYVQPFTWIFINPIAMNSVQQQKNSFEQNYSPKVQVVETLIQDTEGLLLKNYFQVQKMKNSSANEKVFQNIQEKNFGKNNGKKSEKQKSKNNRKDEEEFRPYMAEIKKTRRTPQNANRNVVPNVMHQVISYLQKKSKSEKVINEIVHKLGVSESFSMKRFYLYQLLIKNKLNHYVNAESMLIFKQIQDPTCEIYSAEQQVIFNKISRILVRHFLAKQYDSIILTSKRVNVEKRKDHIEVRRKLLEQLDQIFFS